MGEIIIKNVIKREPGYLYYFDKVGNVCRAKMKPKKKGEKPSAK